MCFTPEREPRWADVYVAATARGVSYWGDYLAATALALALHSAGDKGLGVVALMLAAIVPLAVLGPVAGRLADRFDSRVLLITVGVLQAVGCTVLAYVSHPAVMIALVAVLAAGLAIVQPTLSALLPEMVGRERLGRATAISQTGGSLGMLLGPALGGLLVGVAGSRLPLLIDAGTYLALAAAGLLIRTRRGGRSTTAVTAGPARPAAAAAWRMRDDRLLVSLIVAFAAVIATVTAVNVVELFFVRDTLGSSATVYGVLGATWTAGILLGAWPFGRLTGDDERLVGVQLLALTALSGLIAVSAGVPAAGWLVPVYLVGGCLNAALNVLSGVVIGRRVPAAVRARAFGTFSAVAGTANMIGYAAGGLLLQVFAPRVVIFGTGLLGLCVALVFLLPHLARRGSATVVNHGFAAAAPRRAHPVP